VECGDPCHRNDTLENEHRGELTIGRPKWSEGRISAIDRGEHVVLDM
jgi:hypothetical protein